LRKDVEREIEAVARYNPYCQTAKARETLRSFGIGIHPRPVKQHPHPACKAIENYMLVQAGHHVSDETTCCFMKREKLKLLYGSKPTPKVKLLNEHVTTKDLSRYGDDVMSNVLMHIDTKTAFVHDAMHYYTPDVIGHVFDENPTLERLVYTLVIPPEV